MDPKKVSPTFYKATQRHIKEYIVNVKALQNNIDKEDRSTVVKWAFELSKHFDFKLESYMLAINYMDRFFSKNKIRRGELQLVGAVTLMIAGKFEEIYRPEIKDYIWFTKDIYTKKQFIDMEERILKSLNYHLLYVTPLAFVNEMTQNSNEQIVLCAQYLCILSTLNTSFLSLSSYDIADLSFQLATAIISNNAIPKIPITEDIMKLHKDNPAIYEYFKKKGLKDINIKF